MKRRSWNKQLLNTLQEKKHRKPEKCRLENLSDGQAFIIDNPDLPIFVKIQDRECRRFEKKKLSENNYYLPLTLEVYPVNMIIEVR